MRARPIVASFTGAAPLRRALARLYGAGVRREATSLLLAEADGAPRFRLTTGSKLSRGLAFGAALGGLFGAALGGLLGGAELAGAATPRLAAIIATLAGAGLGGAAGSILGALFGLGAREYRVTLVDDERDRGARALLAVWAEDEELAAKVAEIFAARPRSLELRSEAWLGPPRRGRRAPR